MKIQVGTAAKRTNLRNQSGGRKEGEGNCVVPQSCVVFSAHTSSPPLPFATKHSFRSLFRFNRSEWVETVSLAEPKNAYQKQNYLRLLWSQERKLNAVASVGITDLQGLLQVRKGAAVQLNELKRDLSSAV